jgi:TonB family protein
VWYSLGKSLETFMAVISAPAPRQWAAFLMCIAAVQVGAQAAPVIVKSPAGLEEPQLIPSQMPLTPSEKCKKKRGYTIRVSLTIDAEGRPQQVYLLNALGTDVDRFALEAVQHDRFVPALMAGTPQAVKRLIAIDMETCVEQVKQPDGGKVDRVWLKALPKQTLGPAEEGSAPDAESVQGAKGGYSIGVFRVGGAVSAPVPLVTPQAHYSSAARAAKIQGECIITLIVDEHGMPMNPRVVRSLEPGLDQNALDAVRHYRFSPAKKKDVGPVPVMITIAVNFRLY